MATITLDLSTVTHTLSSRMFGTYIDIFFYQDYADVGYQNLFKAVGFETVRLHCDYYPLSGPSVYPAWAADKAFVAPAVMSGIDVTTVVPATPAHCPSVQSNPTVQGDVAADGTGYSPNDAANWYASIVNQGTNITGVEFTNEYVYPYSSDTTKSPSARELAGTHVSVKRFPPTEGDINWTYDWHNTHYHLYAIAVKNKATSLGRTVRMAMTSAQGVGNSSDMQAHRKFLDGTTFSSGTGINNGPYLDALCSHVYPINRSPSLGLQGMLNSIFHPGDPTVDNDATAHAVQVLTVKRAYMDTHGYSTARQWITEVGPSSGSGTSGLTYEQATADVAVALAVCNGNLPTAFGGNNWGCDTINYTTYSRYLSTNEGGYFLGSTTSPNHRYYAARDVIGPFLKIYKRQLLQTIVDSGNTPGNTANPSVPRIQCAAGLNADGSRIGVMVANLDLSSSETVTLSYGASAAGSVSGTYIPQGWAQSTPAPGIAPFSAGNSFSKAVGPGEVYLFVIPISGGPPPPPQDTNPNTGNWDAAIQVNAAGIVGAPSLDQNFGNWSSALQLNASLTNVPGPPVPGGAKGTSSARATSYGGTGHDDQSSNLPVDPDSEAAARDPAWGGGGAP